MSFVIREHVKLADYTTMGIGGEARYFVEIDSVDSFDALRVFAEEKGVGVVILGGGSNILVNDDGYEGVVVRLVNDGILALSSDDEGVLVEVESGCCWDKFCMWVCERGLGGVESLSGIPGSFGGAVVQNIGAYGQELSEVFVSAEVLDWRSGERRVFFKEDMDFRYRHSCLKALGHHWVVLSARLRLGRFDSKSCVDRCIAHGFKSVVANEPRDAQGMRDEILRVRESKGMVYRKEDVSSHSVGSFFLNPVVSKDDASRMTSHAIWRGHQRMPCFPVDGGMKLSAAWLIEKSGLHRGYRQGQIGLSEKHCLAIVNYGGGLSEDVVSFARFVFGQVKESFGVELEAEALYLGVRGLEKMQLGLVHWGDRKRTFWR